MSDEKERLEDLSAALLVGIVQADRARALGTQSAAQSDEHLAAAAVRMAVLIRKEVERYAKESVR